MRSYNSRQLLSLLAFFVDIAQALHQTPAPPVALLPVLQQQPLRQPQRRQQQLGQRQVSYNNVIIKGFKSLLDIATTTAAICTASPNTWFETSASMPPQCSNYTIDTDPTRNAVFYNSNITGLCDDTSPFSNKPVWFRFLPPAGTAIINYTVPNGYCGTSAPGWYAGQYPSTIYTTATSIACYVIGSNLCWQCNQMSVTNCNTFFVFGLPRSATCNCRYCTM